MANFRTRKSSRAIRRGLLENKSAGNRATSWGTDTRRRLGAANGSPCTCSTCSMKSGKAHVP